jgi:hypothetical protein
LRCIRGLLQQQRNAEAMQLYQELPGPALATLSSTPTLSANTLEEIEARLLEQIGEHRQALAAERTEEILARLTHLLEQHARLELDHRQWRQDVAAVGGWSRPLVARFTEIVEQAHLLEGDLLELRSELADVPVLLTRLQEASQAAKRLKAYLEECHASSRAQLGSPLDAEEERVALQQIETDSWVVESVLRIVADALSDSASTIDYRLSAIDHQPSSRNGTQEALTPNGRRPKAGADSWERLPPQMRGDLERYAQDQFLPGYEEECARYFRAILGQEKEPR